MMRYIITVLCMLLTSVTLTAQEIDEGSNTLRRTVPDSLRRTYRHTEAVQRLAIHRDTVGAIAIWRDIVAEDDGYAPAHYHLSIVDDGDYARSLEHARRAFVADSSNKWYVRNYATSLLMRRQFSKALPVYRRLMSLDKQDLSTYYGLAYAYSLCDMPYSAISVLDSADIRLGHNSFLSSFKQDLLLQTGQYDRAIDEGNIIIAEFPYDMDARMSLAVAYDGAGRDSMTLHTLNEAHKVDSTHVGIIDMLSNYHAYHGKQDRAFDYEVLLMRSDDLDVEKKVSRLYKFTSDNDFYVANYFRIGSLVQALAIKHPDHPDVVDLYSAHLLAAGENEQALDYLRRHLDDKAVTVDDYIFVMQLEHYMGLDELLFADLARALELYPTDFDLLTFAGFVYGDKVGSKRAIKIFKESLAVTEDSKQVSMLWGYIGDAYHEEGNDRRAFAAYDKALQYDPDNVLVLNNYAYFLSLLDRELERALTMSARAIYLEKDNASYLDTHAWVLHRLGRNDEAKTFMRQALSMGMQRDPSYLMHYGDILWALGEEFLAETYWEKAVENGFDAEEMERHKASLMR